MTSRQASEKILSRRAMLATAVGLWPLPGLAAAATPKITITWPWVRATLQHETKGFFVILNDAPQDDRLIHIDSPWAEKCKLQTARWHGLTMSVVEVPELLVPAYSRTELKPGGTWLQIKLARAVTQDDQMPFTLRFARAGFVDVQATVTNRMVGLSKDFSKFP